MNLELEKLKGRLDLAIMKEHDIIGLTTTCAAKLHETLENLSAPIGNSIFNTKIPFINDFQNIPMLVLPYRRKSDHDVL